MGIDSCSVVVDGEEEEFRGVGREEEVELVAASGSPSTAKI